MADITNDVNSLIDEMFAAMQGAPRPDFQALFSKSLGALDAAPDAAQRPVPDAVSPLGTAASTFFGNLASNMSGNPNFAGAVNNSLARYEQERQQIEEENFARKSAYDERKNNQRLSLLMKINELEAEDALKRNDLVGLKASTKANFQITEKIKREDEKRKAEAEAAKAQRDLAGDLLKIKVSKASTPEDKAQKEQEADDKLVLRFQEDIESVAKLPGSTTTEVKGPFLGLFGNETETTKLTPQGIQAITSRSAATATAAGSPRVKKVAIETYFQAMRQYDPKSPEYAAAYRELYSLVKSTYPTPAEQKAWYVLHGLDK